MVIRNWFAWSCDAQKSSNLRNGRWADPVPAAARLCWLLSVVCRESFVVVRRQQRPSRLRSQQPLCSQSCWEAPASQMSPSNTTTATFIQVLHNVEIWNTNKGANSSWWYKRLILGGICQTKIVRMTMTPAGQSMVETSMDHLLEAIDQTIIKLQGIQPWEGTILKGVFTPITMVDDEVIPTPSLCSTLDWGEWCFTMHEPEENKRPSKFVF